MNIIGSSGVCSPILSEVSTRLPEPPDVVFSGHIEVQKASNGYIVRTATRHGDHSTVYVAKTAQEVNEIITSVVATYRLER